MEARGRSCVGSTRVYCHHTAAFQLELVAIEQIGRTSRGAKAAMDAGAQDFFRFRGIGIGKLSDGEVGLHRGYSHAGPHAAGIENALRIEPLAHALG